MHDLTPVPALIGGALIGLAASLFGVGWGLGGYCPGPALVSAASGAVSALVFVVGMTAGTKAEHWLTRWITRQRESDVAVEAPR